MSTRAEAARFVLREAVALGMCIGTDGDDIVLVAPLPIPPASRRSFEAALANYRTEVIAHIIAETMP